MVDFGFLHVFTGSMDGQKNENEKINGVGYRVVAQLKIMKTHKQARAGKPKAYLNWKIVRVVEWWCSVGK